PVPGALTKARPDRTYLLYPVTPQGLPPVHKPAVRRDWQRCRAGGAAYAPPDDIERAEWLRGSPARGTVRCRSGFALCPKWPALATRCAKCDVPACSVRKSCSVAIEKDRSDS